MLADDDDDDAMAAKSAVPASAFQPLCLLRISSAREMCRSRVEEGESLPTSLLA